MRAQVEVVCSLVNFASVECAFEASAEILSLMVDFLSFEPEPILDFHLYVNYSIPASTVASGLLDTTVIVFVVVTTCLLQAQLNFLLGLKQPQIIAFTVAATRRAELESSIQCPSH